MINLRTAGVMAGLPVELRPQHTVGIFAGQIAYEFVDPGIGVTVCKHPDPPIVLRTYAVSVVTDLHETSEFFHSA